MLTIKHFTVFENIIGKIFCLLLRWSAGLCAAWLEKVAAGGQVRWAVALWKKSVLFCAAWLYVSCCLWASTLGGGACSCQSVYASSTTLFRKVKPLTFAAALWKKQHIRAHSFSKQQALLAKCEQINF